MARYFKFHSLEELDAECRRLGLDLRFTDDFSPLFRRVQVGPLRAGNALCVQPMEGCDGTLDGHPDELTYRRYRRFGDGGAKLIWGEAAAVLEEGRATPRQLLVSDATAPSLERMARECRAAHRSAWGEDGDLVLGLQLTHSGRYSHRRPLLACHCPALDALTRVDAAYPLLDDDYLHRLIDHYVAAAKIVARVGFQFIDLKQCHRYLLNELLGARTRPGSFGGSYENRTRLARTVIERVRAEVPGLTIATRLNVFDSVPYRAGPDGVGEPAPYPSPLQTCWGTRTDDPLEPDLTEPIRWAREMVHLGVALLNVSLGNPYASSHVVRPFEYPPPDGYQTPEHPLIGVERHFRLTDQLQSALPGAPVVGSGYSYLQEYLFHAGAANVRDGRCAFVGVGRAALPMPDFARQLLQTGKLDRKRTCRTFSYCTALMRAKHNELGQFATGCPPFDKDVYGPLWEQAKKKP